MRLAGDDRCVCGSIGCWETVASGSALSEAGDVLLVPVREGLASRPKMMSAEPEIRLARHGRWAGAIGAAILAGESA